MLLIKIESVGYEIDVIQGEAVRSLCAHWGIWTELLLELHRFHIQQIQSLLTT